MLNYKLAYLGCTKLENCKLVALHRQPVGTSGEELTPLSLSPHQNGEDQASHANDDEC